MASFLTLQNNVLAMLKVSDSGTRTRVKVAINQAVKEICQVRDWTFLADIDNCVPGTNARSYSLAAYTDKDKILMCRVVTQVTLGDSTTQYDITNPAGTTFRYTYDGTGTNPKVGLGYQQIGDLLTTTGFSAGGNNITNIAITGVGSNYVEVTNASGVVASNQYGVVIKMTEQDEATPIRRRNRLTVAQLSTYTSTGSLLSQASRYCESTNTSIQFDVALATTQAAFIDYKKIVTDLSGDADVCVIPDSYTHIVEKLAFAKILRIDDDTRATAEEQSSLSLVGVMLKQCPYYEPLFDTDDCMECGSYLDR